MGNKVVDWNLDRSSLHEITQGFDYQLIIKRICKIEWKKVSETTKNLF